MSIQQVLDFTESWADAIMQDLQIDHLPQWPAAIQANHIRSRLLVREGEEGETEAETDTTTVDESLLNDDIAATPEEDCAAYNAELQLCLCRKANEAGQCVDGETQFSIDNLIDIFTGEEDAQTILQLGEYELDFSELSWEDWVLFVLGILVGAALSTSAGLGNMCMIALLRIVDSMYYLAIFLKEYADDQEEAWRLSFAGLKCIQLIQTFLTMECGDYIATLNEWWGVVLTSVGVTDPYYVCDPATLPEGEECPPLPEPVPEISWEEALAIAKEQAAEEQRQTQADETPSYESGSEFGRRRLQDAAADNAHLKTDSLGNIFESETTDISQGSFEWMYVVSKGIESATYIAELGVDAEQVYEAWLRKDYYEAGNFIGQASGIVLDEAVELWNITFAQIYVEEPGKANAMQLQVGGQYGPVEQAGNRSESALWLNSFLSTTVDEIEATLPEDLGVPGAETISQSRTLNASEIIPNPEPCVHQTIALLSELPIEFGIKPDATETMVDQHRADAYFKNIDEMMCPSYPLTIVDENGDDLPEELAELIEVNSNGAFYDGKITVDQSKWIPGSPPINLQLKANSGFNQPVYKPVIVKQMTQCDISRTMKRYETSKCTIDEELDETFDKRGQRCSTLATCYQGGYKNEMCPADEHCANWSRGDGSVYAGCVLTNSCDTDQMYSGLNNVEITYNCPSDTLREDPIGLPDGYIPLEDCIVTAVTTK